MNHSGLIECYKDRIGNVARRYWVHPRVLCGGTIMSPDDYARLQSWGITGVLSHESQRNDDDCGVENSCYLPFPDDGSIIPEKLIHDALTFAQGHLSHPDNTLYVHCALGGSRGPSMAYAVCRGVFKLTVKQVLAAIQDGHPRFSVYENPKKYLPCIEAALTTWR